MSLSPILKPIIRRAIIDLLTDIGGPQNDDVIARLLISLGHRVARRDVAKEMIWLADHKLITHEKLGPYAIAEILPDGIDVSQGNLRIDGIDRYRTGR